MRDGSSNELGKKLTKILYQGLRFTNVEIVHLDRFRQIGMHVVVQEQINGKKIPMS
jgi:hypothetical protein